MSGRVDVLVVEDSEDQAALLRNYLERAGCHVTVVGNAEDAVAAYEAQPPRLAVIDLCSRGWTGARSRDSSSQIFPSAPSPSPRCSTRRTFLTPTRYCRSHLPEHKFDRY